MPPSLQTSSVEQRGAPLTVLPVDILACLQGCVDCGQAVIEPGVLEDDCSVQWTLQ